MVDKEVFWFEFLWDFYLDACTRCLKYFLILATLGANSIKLNGSVNFDCKFAHKLQKFRNLWHKGRKLHRNFFFGTGPGLFFVNSRRYNVKVKWIWTWPKCEQTNCYLDHHPISLKCWCKGNLAQINKRNITQISTVFICRGSSANPASKSRLIALKQALVFIA